MSAMIFINNKYTRWYFNIVNQTRNLPKEIYTENHHIIPKSLGGNNSKSNLARLTAKEHYVCHLLLIKMIDDKLFKRKMQFALNSFRRTSKNNQERIKLNSRQYEFIRKQVSQARSEALKGNTYGLGIKRSPLSADTKEKISLSNKGKTPWNKGITGLFIGIPKSEETKQKMRKPKSKEHAENIRKANLGKRLSEETKRKISEAHKQRH
jgi:5-methylcytosine-specific restriction endonuclease McrA